MKRISYAVLALFGPLYLVFAQEEGVAEPEVEAATSELMEVAQNPEGAFAEAYAEAKAAGVSEVKLLEAQLLNYLVTRNFAGLIGLIPKMERHVDDFDHGVGKFFASKRQMEGFISVLKAVKAYQDGDAEALETHAMDAFADAPSFTQSFGIGSLVAEVRMEQMQEQAMADLTIPMNMVIANVEGERKTLKEWMGGNQAMLIDFWAHWCGPCLRAMPSLRAKAEALPEQGVFVAGMNTDDQDQVDNALKIRKQYDMQEVPWLLDPDGTELSSMLFVDSIPRMVLLNPEGKVLFNGHPMDEELETALSELGVELP